MKRIGIIGAGVAGLTAGIYAAKAGFAVEIYEKNSVVGGECTGWDRDGYHIDNCIHWLIGTKPGSALHRLWRETGALGDDVEIIRADHMYTSEQNGNRLTLWQDAARTREEMLALSPADAEEIERLLDYAQCGAAVEIPAEKPPELMGPRDLLRLRKSMKPAMRMFKALAGQDTQDLMARFQHPLLRCAISDFCTRESLASSFPMAYGNFIGRDGGVPRGGSRAMALRMGQRLRDLGGQIYTNADVRKIIHRNGKAESILLADNSAAAADYIVCACDPDYTFRQLLDASYLDPILREIYADRAAYPVYGMFQAAFAVDSGEDALGGDIMLPSGAARVAPWAGERLTLKTYAYEPAFAPAGKQILQAMLGLSEDAYPVWRALYADKAAYAAKKQEIAARIEQEITARFPVYRGKLRLLDAWTPMTYQRYCNAYKGYNQACVITKHSRRNPYPNAWVQGLDNVILANQWLSPPGGLPGAAIQGKYAIQRILKKEKQPIDI